MRIPIESLTDKIPTSPALSRGSQWAQAGILFVLYVIPVLWCFRLAGFADPDVWWHLRSGEWILQHHALLQTDPFSSVAAGRPWRAYSWLFDIEIQKLYEWLGLTGIVAYTMGMVLLFVVLLHRLIRHLQQDFMIGIVLTFAACYCLMGLDSPRSWWFSIVFFVLELDILMLARRSSKTWQLAWLPLIFAVWANVHIQFIDGLIVLFIALAESLLSRDRTKLESRIRPLPCLAITALSMLATLVNPYGWEIYKVAFQLATESGLLNQIREFQPLAFRSLSDYVVLFLALFAVATLARAGRIAIFEITLLGFAVIMSFRSQRDAWIVVVTACAILAAGIKSNSENRFSLKPAAGLSVAGVAVLAAALLFRASHVDNARMQEILSEHMPVRAVEFVKAQGYSGPLFNDLGWGGYLMWDLRMPVTIDGRAPLYGDDHMNRSLATWSGSPDWSSDPDLARAALVIGPVDSALAQLLRTDSRFRLVFEDKVAAVFITGSASESMSRTVSSYPR